MANALAPVVAASSRSKPRIAVEIDGLLADLPTRAHAPIGPPRPGADAFMRRLATKFHIVIYSTRLRYVLDMDRPEDQQVDAVLTPIASWLAQNKIWYDAIWVGHGKPDAHFYLDTRAVLVPVNPTPDDYVQVEAELYRRLTDRR
jgi:hypothetical protein